MENKNIFSITAHLDLLGFSSHLILSSYDLRTKVGREAISRLNILEKVLSILEREKKSQPEFYPETFRVFRFNDSLILGIDIEHSLLPLIGKPNEEIRLPYKASKYNRPNNESDANSSNSIPKSLNLEAIKVAQFLGVVSRIHDFVNEKEFEMYMPGCRTIISSGLRYRFINHKKEEDFYSANFSLSNAYTVNDMGSKHGFIGSKCYVENNVAQIAGYNDNLKRLLAYTAFIKIKTEDDPFDGKDNSLSGELLYTESKKIETDLFNKKYIFREFNTTIGSNLQLFPHILDLIAKYHTVKEMSLLNSILAMLTNKPPSITELNEKGTYTNSSYYKYPLLNMANRLETNITFAMEELMSLNI